MRRSDCWTWCVRPGEGFSVQDPEGGLGHAFGEDFFHLEIDLAWGHAAQAFGPTTEQFHHGKQADRNDDKNGGHGKNGRADLFAQACKHLPRQSLLAGRPDEQNHDDFVE